MVPKILISLLFLQSVHVTTSDARICLAHDRSQPLGFGASQQHQARQPADFLTEAGRHNHLANGAKNADLVTFLAARARVYERW